MEDGGHFSPASPCLIRQSMVVTKLEHYLYLKSIYHAYVSMNDSTTILSSRYINKLYHKCLFSMLTGFLEHGLLARKETQIC